MANKVFHYGDTGKSVITDITQLSSSKDLPNVNEHTGNSHSWKSTQLSMIFAQFDINKIVNYSKNLMSEKSPHTRKISKRKLNKVAIQSNFEKAFWVNIY